MADDATRPVQGGSAQPVFIVNENVATTSTPPASQDVVVTSQPAPPTGASATQVQGNAASGTAIVGNPVRIAGSDGTNVVPLHAYPSVQAGQNFEYVGGAFLSVSASTSVVAAIATTDVGNFRSVYVHVLTNGVSATITPQCSNDNFATAASSNPLWQTAAINGSLGLNFANAGVYAGPLQGRYFRLNVTGISSGSTSVIVIFSTFPYVAVGTVANITAISGNAPTATDGKNTAAALGTTPQLFNGTNTDMQRTPTTFKTVTATASGNTLLWDPAAAKKFRLMGYIIMVTGFAASATPLIDITFQDDTTDMGIGTSLSVPVASATVGGVLLNTGQVQLGNGKLSAVANNNLNINLSAALTAGVVRVTVWGTEE